VRREQLRTLAFEASVRKAVAFSFNVAIHSSPPPPRRNAIRYAAEYKPDGRNAGSLTSVGEIDRPQLAGCVSRLASPRLRQFWPFLKVASGRHADANWMMTGARTGGRVLRQLAGTLVLRGQQPRRSLARRRCARPEWALAAASDTFQRQEIDFKLQSVFGPGSILVVLG